MASGINNSGPIFQSHGLPTQEAEEVEFIRHEHDDTCFIDVRHSDLEEDPINVLHRLCDELEPKHTYLNVDFGDNGADQGGLGRQLISELFKGIKKTFIATNRKKYSRSVHFAELDNGLFRPELFQGLDGKCRPLSNEDKKILQEIGKIFMFCFHPENINNYPIGIVFDQGVFNVLVQLKEHHLSENLNEYNPQKPALFDELIAIYSTMVMFNEDEQTYFANIKKYLEPLSESTDKKSLLDAFISVSLEDEIAKLNINSEIDKIRTHYIQIQETIKKVVFYEKIRPTLTPIIEIAKGMKEANFGYDWKKSDDLDPVILSEYLQGSVTASYIVENMDFSSHTPDIIEEGFKQWVLQADSDKRQKFLFAVTGSPALAGKKIEIIDSRCQFHIHTCTNQIELNFQEVMQTKNPKDTLWEGIEFAIDLISKNKKFDTA